MSTNLSTFPETIDTFIRHLDVGPTDLPNVQRYQELHIKDSLTSAETDEMERLLSALRDKFWLAEDLNKLQDAITNLETFFKYQTEEYIAEVFAAYDERMDALEQNSQDLIQELDEKIDEADAWIADQMATLHDSQYFDFDNMSYRSGFTRKTEKQSETVTVETILNTTDQSVFATRTSTKNGDKDYTVVTVCDKVEPQINNSVHIYKDENGNWMEIVV